MDDVDARLDYVTAELKRVRGRQFAREKPRDDDPGSTNDNDGDTGVQVPGAGAGYRPTAFLARRFKGG